MVDSTAACLVLKNDNSKNSNSKRRTSLFSKAYEKLKSAKHFRVKFCLCRACSLQCFDFSSCFAHFVKLQTA